MKRKPLNHGKPWIEDDLWFLAEQYCENMPVYALARTLKRTENACRAKIGQIKWAYKRNGLLTKMEFLSN